MNFENLNNQIHIYLTVGLAFLLPLFPLVLPLLIGLLLINWLLLYKKIVPGIKFAVKNPVFSCIILLYILYMIGMFYGDDFKSGMLVLETKLSFLIFPLIYSSYYQITINFF